MSNLTTKPTKWPPSLITVFAVRKKKAHWLCDCTYGINFSELAISVTMFQHCFLFWEIHIIERKHFLKYHWYRLAVQETIILGAMLIDISSWNNNLQAYGIRTWEIWKKNKKKNILFEPYHEKTCLMPYANNKGADQPVHPCRFSRDVAHIK